IADRQGVEFISGKTGRIADAEGLDMVIATGESDGTDGAIGLSGPGAVDDCANADAKRLEGCADGGFRRAKDAGEGVFGIEADSQERQLGVGLIAELLMLAKPAEIVEPDDAAVGGRSHATAEAALDHGP